MPSAAKRVVVSKPTFKYTVQEESASSSSTSSTSSSELRLPKKQSCRERCRVHRRRCRSCLQRCFVNPLGWTHVGVQVFYAISTMIFIIFACASMGYKTTFTGFKSTGVKGSWTYARRSNLKYKNIMETAMVWIVIGDSIHFLRLCVSSLTARFGAHGLIVEDVGFALQKFVKGPWFYVYVAGGIPTILFEFDGVVGIRGSLIAAQLVLVWNACFRFAIIMTDLMEIRDRGSLKRKLVISFLLAIMSYYVEIVLTVFWILWTVDNDCPMLGYGSLIGENGLYPGVGDPKGLTVNFPSPYYGNSNGSDAQSFHQCSRQTWLRTSCLLWPLFVDYVAPYHRNSTNTTNTTTTTTPPTTPSDVDLVRNTYFGPLSYRIVGGTVGVLAKNMLFFHAWFYVSNSLRSIGVGDISIFSQAEINLAIIYNIIGLFYWCMFVFSLMNVAWKDLDESVAKLEQSISKVNFLFRQVTNNPDPVLAESAKAYSMLKYLRSDCDSQNQYLASLPLSYRFWIASATRLSLLRSIDTFSEMDLGLLQSLALELKTVYFLQGDVVVESGMHCDGFFYVSGGILCMNIMEHRPKGLMPVEVYLYEGDFFGEKSLFMPLNSAFTIHAKTRCELLQLSMQSFSHAVSQYPGMMLRLKRRFQERIQRIVATERALMAARGISGEDTLLIPYPERRRRLWLRPLQGVAERRKAWAVGGSGAAPVSAGGTDFVLEEVVEENHFVRTQKAYVRHCNCRRCREAMTGLIFAVAVLAFVYDFLCNDFWFHKNFAFVIMDHVVTDVVNSLVVAFVVVVFLLHLFLPARSDFGLVYGARSVLIRAPFLITYGLGAIIYEFQFFAGFVNSYVLRIHRDYPIVRASIRTLYCIYFFVLLSFLRYVCYISYFVQNQDKRVTVDALCTAFGDQWCPTCKDKELMESPAKVNAMCEHLRHNSTRHPDQETEGLKDKCFAYPERRIVYQIGLFCRKLRFSDIGIDFFVEEMMEWYFYVMQSLTTIGYGGMLSLSSSPGMFVLVFVTLYGFLIVNCFYSHVAAVYQNNIEPFLDYIHKASVVANYLKKYEVSQRLRSQVADYYERHFVDFHSTLDVDGNQADRIYNELPSRYLDQVFRKEYIELIQLCPLFKSCNIFFLRRIAHELRLDIFPPGCTIVPDDYTADQVYFIRKGVCAEMNRAGQVTRYLSRGGYCGNFGYQQRNLFQLSVKTISYVQALSINLPLLHNLISEHPGVNYEFRWIRDLIVRKLLLGDWETSEVGNVNDFQGQFQDLEAVSLADSYGVRESEWEVEIGDEKEIQMELIYALDNENKFRYRTHAPAEHKNENLRVTFAEPISLYNVSVPDGEAWPSDSFSANQIKTALGDIKPSTVSFEKYGGLKDANSVIIIEPRNTEFRNYKFPNCEDSKFQTEQRFKKKIILKISKEDKQFLKEKGILVCYYFSRILLLPWTIHPSYEFAVVLTFAFSAVDFARVVSVIVQVTVGISDSDLDLYNNLWGTFFALSILRFYLLLNFGFFNDEGIIVFSPELTAKNYFQTRFMHDFLANFPFEMVVRLGWSSNSWPLCFSLNRLLILWERHKGFDHHVMRHSYVNMIKSAYFYTLCSLLFASIWYWLACYPELGDNSVSNDTFIINGWDNDPTKHQKCIRNSWVEPFLRTEKPSPPNSMRDDCLSGNIQLVDNSQLKNQEAIAEKMQSWNFLHTTHHFSTAKLINTVGKRTRFELFLLSWYWASQSLNFVGYGDVPATTWPERIVAIVIIIISMLLSAYVFSVFLGPVVSEGSRRATILSILNNQKKYLRDKKVPKALLNNVEFTTIEQFNNWEMEEQEAINALPQGIRSEILSKLLQKLFTKIGLNDLPKGIDSYVGSRMEDMIIPQGNYVYRQGDIVLQLYFLVDGHLESSTTNKKRPELNWVDTNQKQIIFGPAGIFKLSVWMSSLRALSLCKFKVLKKGVILQMLQEFERETTIFIKALMSKREFFHSAEVTNIYSKRRSRRSTVFGHSHSERSKLLRTRKEKTSCKVILPSNPGYQIFSFFVHIAVIIQIGYIVHDIAFNDFAIWVQVLDVLYITDMVLKFFVGYYDSSTNQTILELRLIQRNYARTLFILDLFAIFPFYAFGVLFSEKFHKNSVLHYYRVLSLLKLPQFLKVVGIRKKYSNKVAYGDTKTLFILKSSFLRLCNIAIVCFTLGNIFAFISCPLTLDKVKKCPSGGWVHFLAISRKYASDDISAAGLWWAVQTLTTTGFGDILPLSEREIVYTILVIFFFKFYLTYEIAVFTSYCALLVYRQAELNSWTRETRNVLKQLHTELKLEASVGLYRALVSNFYDGFNLEDLFGFLPVCLKRDVYYELTSPFLMKIPYLRILKAGFLRWISLKVKQEVLLPGDLIYQHGHYADRTYYIITGEVEILTFVPSSRNSKRESESSKWLQGGQNPHAIVKRRTILSDDEVILDDCALQPRVIEGFIVRAKTPVALFYLENNTVNEFRALTIKYMTEASVDGSDSQTKDASLQPKNFAITMLGGVFNLLSPGNEQKKYESVDLTSEKRFSGLATGHFRKKRESVAVQGFKTGGAKDDAASKPSVKGARSKPQKGAAPKKRKPADDDDDDDDKDLFDIHNQGRGR